MTRRSRPLLLALVCALGACGTDTPIVDLAIENVTVIDAVNGAREGQTVLVTGGSITSVIAAGEAVAATETIDGTGRFLIPGLWDFHVREARCSRDT